MKIAMKSLIVGVAVFVTLTGTAVAEGLPDIDYPMPHSTLAYRPAPLFDEPPRADRARGGAPSSCRALGADGRPLNRCRIWRGGL